MGRCFRGCPAACQTRRVYFGVGESYSSFPWRDFETRTSFLSETRTAAASQLSASCKALVPPRMNVALVKNSASVAVCARTVEDRLAVAGKHVRGSMM